MMCDEMIQNAVIQLLCTFQITHAIFLFYIGYLIPFFQPWISSNQNFGKLKNAASLYVEFVHAIRLC